MKLINYNYAYIPTFSCSIHGKIVMTYDEWKKARAYLLKAMPHRHSSYYWDKNVFLKDISTQVSCKGNGYRINIRVHATEALVEHYNLKKYKRGNYMLEIMPSI